MYQRYKERFGTVGVVLGVIALIAALGGTAWAATKLNPTQKKEVSKIAKTEAQKYANSNPGAPGANGTNGTNGAKGDTGSAGTNGTNGKSVEIGTATAGECSAFGGSGSTVQVAGEPLTKKAVCNGKQGIQGLPGVIHPGETLPSGASETGAWATVMGKEQAEAPHASLGPIPISFNIPLPEAIPGANIKTKPVGFPTQNLTECEALPEPAEREACEATLKTEEEECPGTEAEPKAKAGFLCLYTALDKTGHVFTQTATTTQAGAALFFAVIGAAHEGNAAFGTWAVTAE